MNQSGNQSTTATTATLRRQARELALQILFQTEFQSTVSFADLLGLFEEKFPHDVVKYTNLVVHGVNNKKEDLDKAIQSVSQHWKVSRMSLVDRNIIRLALFEMKYSTEIVPPSIVINEAIEIAKRYGSTESGAFVNGVLDQLSRGL
jgi:N utilization substance protein B